MRVARLLGLPVLAVVTTIGGAFAASLLDEVQNVSAPATRANELIDVSRVTTYELRHRTKVRLDKPVDTLKVFHARPIEPTWKPGSDPWVTDLAMEPEDAVWQPNPLGGSWWRWQHRKLSTGEYEFESRFRITTARRELRTRRLNASWDDVAQAARDLPPSAEPERVEIPERLQAVARSIRSEHDRPVDAIVAVTSWIKQNIEYSVEIDHRTDDLFAIDRERKGWCGHRFSVFRAMCQELGIPVRIAVGFNTRNADGLWNGVGDWNRHTWAEILLPRVGWIEVEPAEDKTPFAIPRTYIKNPPDLQSFAIWLEREGTWSWGGGTATRDEVRIKPAGKSPREAGNDRLPAVDRPVAAGATGEPVPR